MRLYQLIPYVALLPHNQAASLPATPRNLQPRNNTTATGIPQSLLNNFQLFANFTAASYCPNNENSTSTPNALITCPSTSPCPLVTSDAVSALVTFGTPNDTTLADIKGFVALDSVRELVVVAFAGSGETVRNYIDDFTFPLVPYLQLPECGLGCFIHAGFDIGWAERREIVIGAVTSALDTHPNYEIVITGHSIGAAITTLAAAELRTMNYTVDTYTFGSPRVGNEAFADFVTNQAPQLGHNYRMTHFNDPVPMLPPIFLGYEHTSPEYWLANGTTTRNDYAASQVVVCQGIGNDECNTGVGLFNSDGDAHNHYLGNISACEGGFSI